MKKVLFFLAFIQSVFAQDLPPIGSEDALRTYAIEQSADVYAGIYSYLPIGNESGDFVPVLSPTVAGIENTIKSMPLAIRAVNPKDTLFVHATVYAAYVPGEDRDALFEGDKQFKLILQNGAYALPPDYGDVVMKLTEATPIRIPGATSAQINLQNSNGETTQIHSLRVENGKVYFPRKLAGTNAILTVQTLFVQPNGHFIQDQMFWNTKNGGQITTQYFATPLKASIEGMVTTTDAYTNTVVPTVNGIGKNTTLEFSSTRTTTGFASFSTSEGKWFTGAWVRKAKEKEWLFYPSVAAIPGYKYMSFPVSANAVYFVVPKWNAADLTPPVDTWVPPVYSYEGGYTTTGG